MAAVATGNKMVVVVPGNKMGVVATGNKMGDSIVTDVTISETFSTAEH